MMNDWFKYVGIPALGVVIIIITCSILRFGYGIGIVKEGAKLEQLH